MYLFNAKIENPEKLEQMLVGRENIVGMLVEAQLQKTKGGLPPQFLVVGPRGSGKTHMLKVVFDRLSKNTSFMADHEIAYMVEDETGIGSYFDLLQRILEALKRWSNDAAKTQYIIDHVEHLKELHSREWTKTTEKILQSFLKKKTLLVLIENFDSIMRGMDKKDDVIELAKLRDYIQQYQQISFIATSQSLIHALSEDRNPLYGFFNIINLKRLTLDESFEFVKKIAFTEQDGDLIPFLESHEGRGHLEAIHQFTKGNHRLLLVFFDFLKAEFRSNLSDVFLKSIDELKPYYDSFIKSLAPQQQKIVQYLSLQRNPQKGADIGRNCFLDKSTVSKQLSELQRLGYVNAVNEKGRDKYYEITEPLLRMCFEINEDRNGIIRLFVDFLGQLYSSEQLKEKYLHFNYLDRFQPEPVRKQYLAEAKIFGLVKAKYLPTWTIDEDDEEKLASCCEPDETKKLIAELSHRESIPETYKELQKLFENSEWDQLIISILNILENKNDNAFLYSRLGFAYDELGMDEKAIDSYLKAIALKPDDDSAYYNLGFSYVKKGDLKKAIESYLKAIGINPGNERAWGNLGNSYAYRGEYEKSIEAYLKVIEIKPDDEKAWNNLGVSYHRIGEFNKVNDTFLKAIEIVPNYNSAWYNLGRGYLYQHEYLEAKNSFLNAIKFADLNSVEELIDYYAGLLEVNIKLKEFKEAGEVIDQMFSSPDRLEYLSKLEDSVLLLVSENSETEIREIFIKLLGLCVEHQKLEKFSALLSHVIFSLLKKHSETELSRFEMLNHLFNEIFRDTPEFTYPLRFLNIGIRLFVKGEKEALYELSQEERQLFEKFTSSGK